MTAKDDWNDWMSHHIAECVTCRAAFEGGDEGMCQVAFEEFKKYIDRERREQDDL